MLTGSYLPTLPRVKWPKPVSCFLSMKHACPWTLAMLYNQIYVVCGCIHCVINLITIIKNGWPQTLRDPAARTDANECVLGSSRVKVSRLGVGEESVRPPDLVQHLIANTQFILAGVVEVQSRIMPVLTKVKIQREVLFRPNRHRIITSLQQIHIFEHFWAAALFLINNAGR